MPHGNIEQLLSVNNQLNNLIGEKLKEEIKYNDGPSLFAAFTLGKSFKTHEAIMLLCKNEYGEDAFMLARTLLELAVITSYILQDKTRERLFRYIEYDWVIRKEFYDYIASDPKLLEKLNQEIESGGRDFGTIEQVNEEYKRVMEKYDYSQGRWSDKSIAGMAESIGRPDLYRIVYRMQCNISHTNARSINDYMKDTSEGLFINIGGNEDLIEKTLVAVFDSFRMIIEEADKQFEWDLDDRLECIYKRFVQEVGESNSVT